MNIILLPILGLALARAYQYFELRCLGAEQTGSAPRRTRWLLVACLAGAAAAILAVQGLLLACELYDEYWRVYFPQSHGLEWRFLLSTAVAFAALALMVAGAGRLQKLSRVLPNAAAVLLLGLSAVDLHPVGAEQWSVPFQPEYCFRKVLCFDRVLRESFRLPRCRTYNMVCLPNGNVGWVLNWYFERYIRFDRRVYDGRGFPGFNKVVNADELPYYQRLMGMEDGQRLFVSSSIEHATIKDFVLDAAATTARVKPQLRIQAYDGDNLSLTVATPRAVHLTFIDNWDPDWIVTVNGQTSVPEMLLGTFKSVRLGPGVSAVQFSYRPFRLSTP
jgi:hypothetical protein